MNLRIAASEHLSTEALSLIDRLGLYNSYATFLAMMDIVVQS